MHVVLFEDAPVCQLHPVDLGRAAFHMSCGSYRLIELVRRLERPVRAVVRAHLRGVLEDSEPGLVSGLSDLEERPILLVNARLLPSIRVLRQLEDLARSGCPCIVRSGGNVAAALLSPDCPGRRWNRPARGGTSSSRTCGSVRKRSTYRCWSILTTWFATTQKLLPSTWKIAWPGRLQRNRTRRVRQARLELGQVRRL